MNVKYRIDTVENNERVHVDVRDIISMLQGLSSDVKLNLDLNTMTYVQSIFLSIIATYEASSEDTTLVLNSSQLKRLKTKVFKIADKKSKVDKKALKQGEIEEPAAEPVEENLEVEETQE